MDNLQDRAAEEAVIGSILINPDMYYQVSDILKTEDFYTHHFGWVWDAFNKLSNNGGKIDLVTVSGTLRDEGQLADFGGSAKLTDLINQVPTSCNAPEYAWKIKGFSERRAGLMMANGIATAANNTKVEFDINQHVVDIAMSKNGDGRRSAKEAAGDAVDIVLNPRSMTTSIKSVDKFIGGYFPSELAILAGYQGSGKSAVMKQSARENAEDGARVLVMSFEESAAQMFLKMACGDLKINPSILRSDQVTQKARSEVVEYAAHLGDKYQGKIIVYERRRTPSGIMAAALRERPDIMFVDTLKNVSGQGRESTQVWYDYVIEYLRSNVAKRVQSYNYESIGIPTVLLHHINRSAANSGREPTMQDLKYAGESDSDSVHILYSPDERKAGQKIALVKWLCKKARFGAVGSVDTSFNLPEQKFYSTEKRGVSFGNIKNEPPTYGD